MPHSLFSKRLLRAGVAGGALFVSVKRPVLAATALGLSLACFPAYAAQAQGSSAATPAADTPASAGAAAEGDTLGEITVTAQKRRENLQTTPISISVMDDKGLENRHVVSLLDLGDGSIPGLKIAPFYSRNSALIVNIRGVGVLSDANQPARDQGVGVYIDGVYLGRAQGLGTALFDVQSIEVLKGPQGTLFGRNTEGGAVSITTKKPSGEFHMNAVGGVGNYGSYKGEIHLDLPSWNNFAVKIDGVVAHRDDLVSNPLDSARGFNGYDRHGVHAEVLWTPTSNFSADYSYDNSYDSTTSQYLQLLSTGSNKQAAAGTLQTTRASSANVGVPQQPSIGKVQGHRLTLSWDVASNLTIKSISAYRHLTQSQYDNGSAASTMSNSSGNFTGTQFGRYSLAHTKQNQESQEIQLIGDLPRLKFAGGALYYREYAADDAQSFYTAQFADAAGSTYTYINTGDYENISKDRASHVTTQSLGVFGQATYDPPILNDIVHVTGGLRWSRDAKHGELTTVNGALPVDRDGVSGAIGLDKAWSRVDPMVNLMVDVTDDMHVYGKWSTGYKSGGANSRSQEYDAFNPETVSIFEIGAKTEFLGNRARFNVAAYAGDYNDIQIDFSRPYEIDGVRTTRTTTSTINASGKGSLHGVEVELAFLPVRGLTLSSSFAYQHVSIPATANPYPNAKGVTSTVAVPIYATYTPKYTASGSIDYELPLNDKTLRFHLDGNYDSGYYVSSTDPVYNGENAAGNVYNPKTDPSFIVNGNIALADIVLRGDAKLTVSVWSRNLFNEQHLFYKTVSTTSGTSGMFNEPRTFGIQGQVKL
ncbi:TonB-dependent receptor [Novosphingobium sp. Rr 2-17]|uniref:TonB-dependent receptor n=1 Tax=Novosphingobium sp. Rr 2-17 TaxID=555793 RepID=UPI0002698908|nr:TonB-dependent receptor [Novosphingobium sp. Rr 2-17]EIZ77588.1 TonB-dependent receptor [Novosphingobium sp. Rr 2-17]